MLWSEKYRPTLLKDIDHPLTSILSCYTLETVPNLLIYGGAGHCKKTLINALLNNLELSTSYVLQNIEINNTTVSYLGSKNSIIISPTTYNDRVVTISIIKEFAQTRRECLFFIIIYEAEKMSKDAQAALRRVVERYSKNVRIIMIADEVSSLIEPIRSRFLCLRCAALSDEKIEHIIRNIVSNENKNVYMDFVRGCNGNLRKAIVFAEMLSENVKKPKKEIVLDYERIINDIIRTLGSHDIMKIRKMLYELLAGCVPGHVIIRDIVRKVVKNKFDKRVCEYGLVYNERLKMGNKEIIHLEAFIVALMGLQ